MHDRTRFKTGFRVSGSGTVNNRHKYIDGSITVDVEYLTRDSSYSSCWFRGTYKKFEAGSIYTAFPFGLAIENEKRHDPEFEAEVQNLRRQMSVDFELDPSIKPFSFQVPVHVFRAEYGTSFDNKKENSYRNDKILSAAVESMSIKNYSLLDYLKLNKGGILQSVYELGLKHLDSLSNKTLRNYYKGTRDNYAYTSFYESILTDVFEWRDVSFNNDGLLEKTKGGISFPKYPPRDSNPESNPTAMLISFGIKPVRYAVIMHVNGNRVGNMVLGNEAKLYLITQVDLDFKIQQLSLDSYRLPEEVFEIAALMSSSKNRRSESHISLQV